MGLVLSVAAVRGDGKLDAGIRPDSGGEAEFFLFLAEQADLAPASSFATKGERGRFVFETLREVARRTQTGILADLDAAGLPHRAYWAANMIWVRSSAPELEALARRGDVARVLANPRLDREEPFRGGDSGSASGAVGIEWNIAHVGAPDVWDQGVTGQGAVIGGVDSGYDWDHPALKGHYRGWNGTTADHDYNWHDAVHEFGQACGNDSPEPCDEDGHGTHTMGTMVGDDGAGNQIGMAPGAQWIGCRCWNPVLGTNVQYVTECLQWMLAPTDLGGENPDPGLAPDVVNNSWICEPDEGCVTPDALLAVVESLRAAGIVVVAGAGNDGPGCGTIAYPPAVYDASFTVGASDDSDMIALFSSRGPVTVDGSNRLKPDVTAPGISIRSCVPGGAYQSGWSGTSMAAPHVAGLVALLVSANPGAAGDVELLEGILHATAVPMTSGQSCGGVGGFEIPNNTSGYGRIDAPAAYAAVLTSAVSREPLASPRPVLLPAAPNPFHPSARIAFDLPGASRVSLTVFDPAGRRIRRLLDRVSVEAGRHRVSWDGRDAGGRDVQSGVYFIRLEAGEHASVRPITRLRAP
jgi:subtilisin family serine protease